MKKNIIVNTMLYSQDLIKIIEEYSKIMDKYYLDKNNDSNIDTYAMEQYVSFRLELKNKAIERGLIK